MGEAKQKNLGKVKFLKEHTHCCYCGGTTAATTVDHVPSIQMFALRRRPKGLEVPACAKCNHATRQHEQVAAMLGRVYPDPPQGPESDEIRDIFRAVNNNNPGLLQEMRPSTRQRRRFRTERASLPRDAEGALNVGGPLLNKSLQIFGAKLGFALHYAKTGKIIPPEGGVAVRWYSNHDAFTGGIPSQLLQILGPGETLTQGKWSAGDQFNFAYALAQGGNSAAYFSTFRRSFAILSWTSSNAASFGEMSNIEVHRPGHWTTDL